MHAQGHLSLVVSHRGSAGVRVPYLVEVRYAPFGPTDRVSWVRSYADEETAKKEANILAKREFGGASRASVRLLTQDEWVRASGTSASSLNMAMGRWGRGVLEREFYLPKEAKGRSPVTIEDLEIYPYEYGSEVGTGAKYGAVVFAGKAQKPLWHYTYRTAEMRDKKLAETIASRRGHRKLKEAASAAKKAFKHDFKVGDIFDTSWGYDQTNVEFFQVVEVRGAILVVREIAQSSRAKPGEISAMTDRVVGIKDKFIGPPKRVRPTHGGGIKIEGHYASKWDGSPQYTSSYA